MPRVYPWNSVKENVHHDNTRCGSGKRNPSAQSGPRHQRKPLCKDYAKLDREGK